MEQARVSKLEMLVQVMQVAELLSVQNGIGLSIDKYRVIPNNAIKFRLLCLNVMTLCFLLGEI